MVKPVHLLYISHMLSRWGGRMWAFAAALFLMDIWPDTLLLVSTFATSSAAAQFLLGGSVGSWADRTNRLVVARVSLLTQNLAIVACASSIVALELVNKCSETQVEQTCKYKHDELFYGLVVGIIFTGAVEGLGRMANTNALEMDWAPVMAAGDKALLANINTIMRRIDLVCKLAAPAAAGAILDAVPVFWAAVGIAGWNLLSVVLEMVMQRCVYDSCPALHTLNRDKLVKKKQNVEELDENIDSSEERQDDQEIGKGAKSCLSEQLLGNPTDSLDEGVDVKQRQKQRWSVAVFFSYSEAAPALCLSLLYFTVLSGGFLMTGYLKYRGISQAILGAAQGAGAVFGVLATLCFQKMRLCVGIKSAGLIGIWFQVAFLFISVSGYLCTQQAKNSWPYISFHVDGLPKWFDAAALMGGVAVSRWGLWLFDLSVAQQITEGVAGGERGAFAGVLSAVQQGLFVLILAGGIVFNNPKDFYGLGYLSLACTVLTAIVYSVWSCCCRASKRN